jgi:hypothetical protein
MTCSKHPSTQATLFSTRTYNSQHPAYQHLGRPTIHKILSGVVVRQGAEQRGVEPSLFSLSCHPPYVLSNFWWAQIGVDVSWKSLDAVHQW